MKKMGLDKRERKFVAGVVEGKSLIRAAKDAGYAKSTAEKKSFAILRRPLVWSELTKALEACGVKLADIMRPIADALKARKSYIHPKAGLLESGLPDHAIRLDAADRAIRLMGGIPKVGETIPAVSGVNLFISTDNDQRTPA
jgi:hypothetical protein